MKSSRSGKRANDGRKQLGAFGEELAANYLSENGFRIIQRNWRCRTGEIDIIAWEQDLLVFIEVRTRSSIAAFGTPEESVGYFKQRKIIETAQVYLYMNDLNNLKIRFDIIAVQTGLTEDAPVIKHIRNAI